MGWAVCDTGVSVMLGCLDSSEDGTGGKANVGRAGAAVFTKKASKGPKGTQAEFQAPHFTESETETQSLKQFGCVAKQLNVGPGARTQALARAQGWAPGTRLEQERAPRSSGLRGGTEGSTWFCNGTKCMEALLENNSL